jgi:5-methylcytosine-specific restriction endonuclease McrA
MIREGYASGLELSPMARAAGLTVQRVGQIVYRRTSVKPSLRARVLDLYPACLACGATEQLQVDHVVPVGLGGSHDISNLQTLCGRCNRRKRLDTTDHRPVA